MGGRVARGMAKLLLIVAGLLVLCGFWGLGFIVAAVTRNPLPAPVIGMILLVAALRLPWPARIRAAVGEVSDLLIRLLPLFLVPAAVGVISQFGVIADAWLPVLVTIGVSWVVAFSVAALLARAAVWAQARPKP